MSDVGRHEHPDGGAFYRSLGISALRALLILVVVALATAAVVVLSADLSPGSPAMEMPQGAAASDEPDAPDGPDEQDAPDATEAGSRPALDVALSEPTQAPTPTPTSTPTSAPTPTPEPAPSAATEEPEVKEPGATLVQVLDGGGGPSATQEVVGVLRDLGYDIVAVSGARCCYEETTVLFTEGNEAVGRALADRDDRLKEVRANPNLSESVDLHVVVGRDWSR